MKYNSYIMLDLYKKSGGILEAISKYNDMCEWLNERDIDYDRMKGADSDIIPHTLLMDSKDAVAFKLKFGYV